MRQHAADAVVDTLGPLRDVGPRVHLLDLVVKELGADLALAQPGDGAAGRGDEIVLLRLRELGHVARKHFGDAADAGADDVEAARGRFHDHSAERFRQRRVQVDVPAHHDAAHFFVPHGAQQRYAVLENVAF